MKFKMSKWRASHRQLTFDLPVSSGEAKDLCRQGIRSLGWDETGSDDRIAASENPAQLCCVVWPVDVQITVHGAGAASQITVEGATPGRGPIQKRQLEDRLDRLAAEIRRRAALPAG